MIKIIQDLAGINTINIIVLSAENYEVFAYAVLTDPHPFNPTPNPIRPHFSTPWISGERPQQQAALVSHTHRQNQRPLLKRAF